MSAISLMGLPFIVALEITVILGYIGIHVLKREVIFVDISMAQVAAVGAIIAHLAFAAHGDSLIGYLCAFGATLIVAGFYSLVRRRDIQIPLEAVIGVTYAIAAALALFLVGVAPGGHVHIHQMLAGSILWATTKDVVLCGVVFAIAGLCFYLFRKPLTRISDNYEEAVLQGVNTAVWDFVFYALVGIIITVAVRIAGVIVVFTFLIIPATLSAMFAGDWGKRLIITWIAGAVAVAIGLLFADVFDFSVGPAIALFLGVALVLTSILRLFRIPKTVTAIGSLALAAILFVWFLSMSGTSDSLASKSPKVPDSSPVSVSQHEVEAQEEVTIDPSQIAMISDPDELASIFNDSEDMEIRTAVVDRMFEIGTREGVRIAIEFLKTNPPLLFRKSIVDKLRKLSGGTFDYNIEEPFGSTDNQRAIKMISKL